MVDEYNPVLQLIFQVIKKHAVLFVSLFRTNPTQVEWFAQVSVKEVSLIESIACKEDNQWEVFLSILISNYAKPVVSSTLQNKTLRFFSA